MKHTNVQFLYIDNMQLVEGTVAAQRDLITVICLELFDIQFFKGREDVHRTGISVNNIMEIPRALSYSEELC